MRLSEFRFLMDDEFGAGYAGVIENSMVLLELGDRTASIALAQGEEPRVVWQAICKANEVPKSRWHGKTKPNKKQHAE
jgi:hypothetical protein